MTTMDEMAERIVDLVMGTVDVRAGEDVRLMAVDYVKAALTGQDAVQRTVIVDIDLEPGSVIAVEDLIAAALLSHDGIRRFRFRGARSSLWCGRDKRKRV